MHDVDFQCSGCRFMLSAEAKDIESNFNCPNCNTVITVPFMFSSMVDTSDIEEKYASLPASQRIGVRARAMSQAALKKGDEGEMQDADFKDRAEARLRDSLIRDLIFDESSKRLDNDIKSARDFADDFL
jgi:hypothetical protein